MRTIIMKRKKPPNKINGPKTAAKNKSILKKPPSEEVKSNGSGISTFSKLRKEKSELLNLSKALKYFSDFE